MSIRLLMIWLFALALAAQGVSAATMAFCGQAGHRITASAQAGHAGAGAHDHHAGHATDAAERPSAPSADPSAVAPSADPSPVSGDSHGCSACASCCSAGALLSAVPIVPAPAVEPTVFAAVASAGSTHVADGLERPPRIDLA